MSNWKQDFAREAEKAFDFESVKYVMEEFAENLRHNPDVAAEGMESALFRYGLKKVCSYVAQTARAQALGIDPEMLRMSPEEATERQLELARMAAEVGKPVWIIEAEEKEG